MLVENFTEKDIARFWSKIEITKNQNDCWKWKGFGNNKHRPKFSFKGENYLITRIIWQLVYGEIPANLWILHSCDVGCCVNPLHLHLGTPKENTAEAFERGRLKRMGSRIKERSEITGQNLKQYRLKHQLSKETLADMLEVSLMYFCQVEEGLALLSLSLRGKFLKLTHSTTY